MVLRPLIALLLVLLLAYSTVALELGCDKKNARQYLYVAEIDGLGGEQATASNQKIKTIFQANIVLECHSNIQFKKTKRSGMVNRITVKNVQMTDTNSHLVHDMSKYFADPVYFSISINGKVHKIYRSENEAAWVRSMKKSMISLFHTKLHGYKRLEMTSNGIVNAHYEQQVEKDDGGISISRKYTEVDVQVPAHALFHPERIRLDSKDLTHIDKNGFIHVAARTESIRLGTTSKRQHAAFQHMKNILTYEKGQHLQFESREDPVYGAKIYTYVQFMHHVTRFAKFASKFEKDDNFKTEDVNTLNYAEDDESEHDTHETLSFHDATVETNMQADEAEVLSAVGMHREQLSKKINIQEVINSLAKTPTNNLKQFADALAYVQFFPESVNVVMKKFNQEYAKYKKLDPNTQLADKIDRFMRMCQTLLLGAETELGQKLFLTTFKTESLIGHGVRRAAEVKKPTTVLIRAIFKLQTYKGKDASIPVNAYLVVADLAHRSPKGFSRSIVKRIAKNLKNAPIHDKQLHLHALGNAGDAAPLKAVLKYIMKQNAPINVRLAALKALRKRYRNDSTITSAVNRIVSDKRQPLELRVAAIAVQTQRELLVQSGSSMPQFMKLLFNRKTPAPIQQAIVQYVHEEGSDEAGEALLHFQKIQNNEYAHQEEEDAESARVLWGWFRRAANSVKRGFNQATNHAREAAERAQRAVREAAERSMRATREAAERAMRAAREASERAQRWAQEQARAAHEATQRAMAAAREAAQRAQNAAREAAERATRWAREQAERARQVALAAAQKAQQVAKETAAKAVVAANKVKATAQKTQSLMKAAASKVGTAIKNTAVKVGNAVKDTAVKVGNAVKNTFTDLFNRATKLVGDLKKAFSAAKFSHERTCINGGKGSEICLYDADMVTFVQQQGDLRKNVAKSFSFEKLIGAESLHLYVGAVGYLGTFIKCNAKDGGAFQFNAFARGSVRARFFSNRMNVIQAAFSIAQPLDSDMRDKVFVEVGPTVLMDKSFVPESISKCEPYRKNLWRKEYPRLVEKSFTVVIVAVPATFTFTLGTTIGVDFVLDICVRQLRAVASLEPFISVSVSASASIGVPMLQGGVNVKLTTGYRLQPNFGFKDCRLCAALEHQVDPTVIDIKAYFKAFKFEKNFDIYSTSTQKVALSPIVKICSRAVNIELGAPEEQEKPEIAPRSATNKIEDPQTPEEQQPQQPKQEDPQQPEQQKDTPQEQPAEEKPKQEEQDKPEEKEPEPTNGNTPKKPANKPAVNKPKPVHPNGKPTNQTNPKIKPAIKRPITSVEPQKMDNC